MPVPAVGLRYDSAKGPHAINGAAASPLTLTYRHPFLLGQSSDRWKARLRLFGHSCVTAIYITAFQKERLYEPDYPWGGLLVVLQTLLTSTLLALFALAVRRQFRR